MSLLLQATPVYRTNDPFTFKINDFKLPSDLVDDIVNKRYPACLAVLITESLELEGLWVPSASPNIKDKVPHHSANPSCVTHSKQGYK